MLLMMRVILRHYTKVKDLDPDLIAMTVIIQMIATVYRVKNVRRALMHT